MTEQDRDLDPVDLLLDGRREDAFQEYLSLYIEALSEGDTFIGQDLLPGMHFCMVDRDNYPTPESATGEVERRVLEAADRQALPQGSKDTIRDQLEIARSALRDARKRSESSVMALDGEKDEIGNESSER